MSVVDHDGRIIVCARKSHKLSHSKVVEFDVEQGKWKQSKLLTIDKDYVVLRVLTTYLPAKITNCFH